MSPVSIALIAVSMSLDSFFAAVGRGAGHARPHLKEIAVTGFVFALVQMATPLIGWGSGTALSDLVAPIDHWLAFGLLAAVGGRMIAGCCDEAPSAGRRHATLLATAIGTSIDALAVGVSLAFLDVNIVTITLAIGLATFVMTAIGMVLGRLVGRRHGRIAEIIGGVVLIGLGVSILIGHLAG